MIKYKECTKCHQIKIMNDFHKRSDGINKYASHCIQCISERGKKLRRKSQDYHIARKRLLRCNKEAILNQKVIHAAFNQHQIIKKYTPTYLGFSYITICSSCLDIKTYSDFGIDKHNQQGLTHKCKSCTHEYRNKNWWDNREKRLSDKSLSRSKCSDSYIRELIVKRKKSKALNIPLSLISLYRQNLKITRFIKSQGENV